MKKILLLPDIHGRDFWKKPCEDISIYDKVIFLGDYFDPYDFEDISVQDCIDNFQEILRLKRENMEKVILLLGNHDFPYFSNTYYRFSHFHCRHSSRFHQRIHGLFNDNRDFFQIAYVIDDILFTHAGVDNGWWTKVIKSQETDINKICSIINDLPNNREGLQKLYFVSASRGGHDEYGSCVWCDVHDMTFNNTEDSILKDIKQIFGHTLQAFYDRDYNIVFGKAIEFDNCKMIDTARPYVLDVDKFKIEEIGK